MPSSAQAPAGISHHRLLLRAIKRCAVRIPGTTPTPLVYLP